MVLNMRLLFLFFLTSINQITWAQTCLLVAPMAKSSSVGLPIVINSHAPIGKMPYLPSYPYSGDIVTTSMIQASDKQLPIFIDSSIKEVSILFVASGNIISNLTDPAGHLVELNDPGTNFNVVSGACSIRIKNPLSGKWHVQFKGHGIGEIRVTGNSKIWVSDVTVRKPSVLPAAKITENKELMDKAALAYIQGLEVEGADKVSNKQYKLLFNKTAIFEIILHDGEGNVRNIDYIQLRDRNGKLLSDYPTKDCGHSDYTKSCISFKPDQTEIRLTIKDFYFPAEEQPILYVIGHDKLNKIFVRYKPL